MRIPYTQLSPSALDAIILEFVTRDGTDHSAIDQRIAAVLRQLKNHQVAIEFDSDAETCNIVVIDGA